MAIITFIPIDNRPVCYQLPIQIAKLAKEHELRMPDISLMGDLKRNADINGLLEWLSKQKNTDIFVISLDTIAYGGLIPSRKSNDSIETIKTRIDKLVEIIKKQKAKVYAFSSIMRISNNNINEEEKEYWSEFGTKIFEYSYNIHKSEILNLPEPQTDIPQKIINDYLLTRNRNFEINKYYIELYKQGVFETLVFSKDDCAEYGLNVKEANQLKDLSVLEENIFVKTGADEIPLTLLSRALTKHKKIKIAPLYTNIDSINKISKYEDISVEESVNSQIELAGGIVSDIDNCDLIILINNFKTEQGELVMDIKTPLFDGKLNLPDKPYFIADILNANGSDNNFIKALFEQPSLKEFYGYTAWNTTGNTLGSAISAALIYFGAKKPNKHAFQELQITRFLDDWAYQANVRAKIRDNKENLLNDTVQKEMQKYEKILFDKFGLKYIEMDYYFPWNRFFEVKISVNKNYYNIPFVEILFK
ncbi:DUF4127 family protein [bacterium]|nr:DUF4127 family protein [bacterium]